jgi:hypothetical protein
MLLTPLLTGLRPLGAAQRPVPTPESRSRRPASSGARSHARLSGAAVSLLGLGAGLNAILPAAGLDLRTGLTARSTAVARLRTLNNTLELRSGLAAATLATLPGLETLRARLGLRPGVLATIARALRATLNATLELRSGLAAATLATLPGLETLRARLGLRPGVLATIARALRAALELGPGLATWSAVLAALWALRAWLGGLAALLMFLVLIRRGIGQACGRPRDAKHRAS